jgi:hypothetical protein
MNQTPSDSEATEDADNQNPSDQDSGEAASSPSSGASRPGSESGDAEVSDDEYRQTVSQLNRVSAPPSFRNDLEETIRRRSGGRFFGRKAFGDRVPYEIVIAVLILAVGLVAYLVLRSSSTGSLRYQKEQDTPIVAPDTKDVVPQPAPVD